MMGNRFVINAGARRDHQCVGLFESVEYESVNRFYSVHRPLEVTPLPRLSSLAAELGIKDLLVKDESWRLGLNSFKVLGVLYAVNHLMLAGRLGPNSVLVCASEGNHGRAVAHVAAHNNFESRIYVAADTVPARIKTIENEGGRVVVVDGTYDDAVRQAIVDAGQNGWDLVSDTSWPRYEEIPRLIMAGYTQLLTEAAAQWLPDPPPDLVLVQAGVGGLACAVASWLCQHYQTQRPFLVVCEPEAAASFLESMRQCRRISLRGPFNTIMAGLRCGEASHITWPTIAESVDAFVAISDQQCIHAMRRLAYPGNGDPVVTAGASGACGLAALLSIVSDQTLKPLRDAIGLGQQSRVLVINTEGATDLDLYSRLLFEGEAETKNG